MLKLKVINTDNLSADNSLRCGAAAKRIGEIMTTKNMPKKILALLLAVLLCCGYLSSAAGQAYATAHPAAVNGGKSSAEIEADDLEQFSKRSGYDYHDAKPGTYAENELILEITSSAGAAAASISSFEDEFDLKVQRVLNTTDLQETGNTKLSSVGGDDSVITSYFMTTEQDDIIGLCDSLNEREEVFNAQPNFAYETCDEAEEVDMSEPAEDTTQPTSDAGVTTQIDDSAAASEAAEQEQAPQATAPAETPEVQDTPSKADSYTTLPGFSGEFYGSRLQWWFEHCQIPTAWSSYADSTTGYGLGKGINVAVIDTGCNVTHNDIKDNLWTGPSGECGYNAYRDTTIAKTDTDLDVVGHGTHCCGSIAMNGDNTIGGIGTAPRSSVMVMKADRHDGKNVFYDSELITSLYKSRDYGADIISMSLGGSYFSYATYRTYQEVSSSCLIVCAAGNDHLDTSEKLHFPAAASCVIGVMALGDSDNLTRLATFSNYDTSGLFYKVAAPGTEIFSLSTSSNSTYTRMNGTSMATPITTGMIASFMSYVKYVKGWDWTPAQYQYEVENIINNSGNSLTCGAYSQEQHPVAYNLGSSFKVMNLKHLLGSITAVSSNPFANSSAVSFNNSVMRDGVINATGLQASELDTYALKRVSLLYWEDDEVRKSISDFSDLPKLTGLNHLDLSGCSNVTSSNIESIISGCAGTLFYLDLNTGTHLGNLPCLANAPFSHLYYLNVCHNNMTTLDPLAKFTCMRTLYAYDNELSDISAISSMKHTEYVEFFYNEIEDPTPAFSSDCLWFLDLEYNEMTDHTKLFNFSGAFHSTKINSDTIYFYVGYNYLTGLTEAIANSIIDTIKENNTVDGVAYTSTVKFTYANQSEPPAATVPMTSFTISDKTVTREALCAGNLNLNTITGFTPYPGNADSYNYLTWTCSESGYFDSEGNVLVTPEQITSCRTLTLTGTAPEGSNAVSSVTGEASQTIQLTITAPEIQSAYLTDRVISTGTKSAVVVATNQYTSYVVLKFSKTGSEDVIVCEAVSNTTVANGNTKVSLFNIPAAVYNTPGTYECTVYPADSAQNYTTTSDKDISGNTSYPYKSLGALYVKNSVQTATDFNVAADTTVNRYGQGALYSVNSGSSASSPAKPSGSYSTTNTGNCLRYIGLGMSLGDCAGYFGKPSGNYPSAATGESSYGVKNNENSNIDTVYATVNTVAPAVKHVAKRNALNYRQDGYVDYLIKTNTDATQLKTYLAGTTTQISSTINHVATVFSDEYNTYAAYGTYSYKLWSVRVPLTSDKQMQAVTFVAADPLGDGAESKTPATGLEFTAAPRIYANESPTKLMKDYLKLSPTNSAGESLANCFDTVAFSISASSYFTLNSSATGEVTADMERILGDLERSTSDCVSTSVTASLGIGGSVRTTLSVYRPIVSDFTYDADSSALISGGTVNYSVKTYGSDTITVSDSDDQPLVTLTLEDIDAYSAHTDENGNEFIIWHFSRTFPLGVSSLKTYVRSSYRYSDTLTSHSASAISLTVNREWGLADYSLWYEQSARVDETLLSALAQAYGTQTELYARRLTAYRDVLEGAILTYNETQQSLVDAQTLALKEAIDNLLGYSDYAASIEAYEALLGSENAKYINAQLTDLVSTEVTDATIKSVSAAIDTQLARIEALVEKTEEVQAYLAVLESRIPALLTDEIPECYSVSSYTALKQAYDSLKNNLSVLAYEDAQTLEIDYSALLSAYNNLHEHTYMPVVKQPTCTAGGYTTYTCLLCGDEYVTDYTAALGHIAAAAVEEDRIDPGCETQGSCYLVVRCKRCSVKMSEEPAVLPALGHSWDEWRTVIEPTCTEAGEESRVCRRDASHTETREMEAYGHAFEVVSSRAPTCTKKGVTVYQCPRCNESYTETVNALGHSAAAPVEEERIEPGCEIEGSCYSVVRCERCNVKISEEPVVLPALGHNWNEWEITKDPTCTEAGEESRVCKRDASHTETRAVEAYGHAFELVTSREPTCTKNGINVYQCSRCNESYIETVEALGHSAAAPVEEDRIEPGCETDGSYYSVVRCERCNVKMSEEQVILPALGHNWNEWEITKDPTCTEAGEESRVCSRDASHTETRAVEAYGHAFELVTSREPTCTKNGINVYQCLRCDENYIDTVNALGHSAAAPVEEDRTEPGCETDGGYYSVVRCERCNVKISEEPVALPALGHSWGEWVTTTDPTCTQAGKESRVCSRDASHIETRAVEAYGHTFEIVSSREPTCTKQGIIVYQCPRCGESYHETIDTIAHSPAAAVEENRSEPGCESEGSYDSVVYCRDCHIEISREKQSIAAIGHDWGAWEQTTAPGCTAEGAQTRVCKRDASHTETKAVEALGHSPAAAVEENRVEPGCVDKGSYQSVVYCSVCDEKLSETTVSIAALGHSYVGVVTEPTCKKNGYTTYTCSRCDASYISDYTAAVGHTPAEPVEEDYTAPGCEIQGSYKSVVYCLLCHTQISRQTVSIPALGHDYVPLATEPTCTEKGYTTYNCSRCDASYAADYVDALGHTPKAAVEENRTDPTCEQKGCYDIVVYCAVCETELSRQTNDIPALGHDWSEWAVTTPAIPVTCTADGKTAVETRTCSRCTGVETRGGTVIEKNGHTPAQAVRENEKAATCAVPGSYDEVVYCQTCREELSRAKVIVTVEHNYTSVVSEPTCTHMGYTTYTCEGCAYTFFGDYVPMTAHRYVDTVVEPTTEVQGYTVHTCMACGYSYVDSITDVLPSPMHYIIPSLEEIQATLTIKSAENEYTVTSSNGVFEINDIKADTYRVYAKQKNSLTVYIDEISIESGDIFNENIINLPLGDVNADNVIDMADLSVLLASENYGRSNTEIDLNGDGLIDISDISLVLKATNYGMSSVKIV